MIFFFKRSEKRLKFTDVSVYLSFLVLENVTQILQVLKSDGCLIGKNVTILGVAVVNSSSSFVLYQ